MKLIDRDKLLKFKQDVYDYESHHLYAVPTGIILRMPTVDDVPIRRGHWVNDSDGLPVCPFCDKVAMQRLHCNMLHESWQYDIRLEKTPYCPFCGADLREGEKNG